MVRDQPSRRGRFLASLPADAGFVHSMLGSTEDSVFQRCLLILIAVLVCGAAPVLAGEGFQPVPPEELKMTSEPQALGAPAIILFRQVDRDDNGRTSNEYNYLRIKVLTEEGRKYADVEIPFFKTEGNIVGIRARTIRPDGSVVNFDGKIYEKFIVKAKGVKYLAKTFTLPDVQVGSIIEYFYTQDLSEHYIYDSHWILSNELFTKRAKFTLKPYQSRYEPISVRWSWQGLPPGTEPPKEGPDRIVRLEVQNVPAFQTEDYMPPANELKARVDFTYSEERFESDANKFWKQTGKKLNDKVEGFVGKRKSMEQAVAQIVSPNDPAEVKAQKLYARVQQLRNTSYEIHKTEQEQKRDKEKGAANVEDVWRQGYGEGQQLTWLYLALVRAAGIEAYPVWASDRSNYFFNPNLMDSRKLDANLVLLKLNGKEVYCDPGAAFTPFGLLPWPETGVAGLRLEKDGGTWITTMLPRSSDSRIERKADLKLSDATGSLEGNLTVTFTGLEALQRRLEERNADEADRKTFLEEQVKEYIPAASGVELTNKPEWSNSSASLVAEFHLKIPGWASGAGRRALLPVGLFTATEKHVFDHATRVHPIYFQYPFEKVDDISIGLPLEWAASGVPAPQNFDAKVVGYALKVENGKGTLHLSRTLNVDVVGLEPKYYGALRNFFHTVKTGDEQQVVLQPGEAAAKN
jgi:transglutaminase-like putative cysteine protease